MLTLSFKQTPRAYCGAETSDLRFAISHVHSRFPDAPLVACGYSLGSNLLVKYLGEEGDKTPLLGAVSCSNPYNFVMSSQALPLPYSQHMSKGLVKYFMTCASTSLAVIKGSIEFICVSNKEILSQHPEIGKVADKVQLVCDQNY